MNIDKQGPTASELVAALQSKFQDKSAQVGIIGLGYVGLPLALAFTRKGFQTTGFDIDPAKVEKLQSGVSYIRHVSDCIISEHVKNGRFHPTSTFADLRQMDAILICVPTPLGDQREPDLTYVRNTAEQISTYLRPGQLIVLESTTYPGTTDEVVLPIMEKSGLRCPRSSYSTDGNTVTSLEGAKMDYAHAREVYQKRLAECKVD